MKKHLINKNYFWIFTLLFLPLNALAFTATVKSPDESVIIKINNQEKGLSYSVEYLGQNIIDTSPLGLVLDNLPYGDKPMLLKQQIPSTVDETIDVVAGKVSSSRNHYNQTIFAFESQDDSKLLLSLYVRAYNNGAAIRYGLPYQTSLANFTVQKELTQMNFPQDYNCFGLNLGKFTNSHEGEFDPLKASKIREHNLFDSPFVCKTGKQQTTFALAEANVKNYPGAWYTGRGDGRLGVQVKLTPRFDNPKDGLNPAAAKITMTKEGVATPWRVVMLGKTPGELTESNLIFNLGEPSKVEDPSWIKPGKTAWDWWNNNMVAIENPGMNTETYFAYTDFAATLGLEYILIDAGWHEGAAWTSTPGSDLLKPIKEMDMPAILKYAKSKNVDVWVWVQWKQLDWQMEEALSTYEKWGIKGIKVDFMDRSDQEMVNYYHKLLTMTAKYHIMVDMHGAYAPNGLTRTYPHYLTQEGVLGAEYNKWSTRVTATHNVTIPFTRMILGPIDYTPGGFNHVTPEEFEKLPWSTTTYVKTTRGHALAMYVVYDSPLQMLADSPISYSKTDGVWPQPESEWQDGLSFIKDVPVIWDETRILQGDIGEFIVSARRKGSDWYIGAMTNEQARKISVKLDFLNSAKYNASIWQDGKTVSDVTNTQKIVKNGQKLKLKLAPSGGAAIHLTPMQ